MAKRKAKKGLRVEKSEIRIKTEKSEQKAISLTTEQYDKCKQACLELGQKYNNLMAFEGFDREPIKIPDVDLVFEAFYLRPEKVVDFLDDFADHKIKLLTSYDLFTTCIPHTLDDTLRLYLGDVRSILRYYWEGKPELTQTLEYGEEAPLVDYYGNPIDRSDALKSIDKICEIMLNIIHSYKQLTGTGISPLGLTIAYWEYSVESLARGIDVPHVPFRNHFSGPYDEVLGVAVKKLVDEKKIRIVEKRVLV